MTLTEKATGWACPSCETGEFWEWNETTDSYRAGGRWCERCGYGVHPPPPTKAP